MSVKKHWEIESVCPKCEHTNVVTIPAGEQVVRVHCEHCTHGYDYTHVVQDYVEIDD
ncbi:hypothetical protein [Alicyclobacillus dauci]|uniref:Uncharacterized protein n=1 Tax=Alicyclobacillus dauci TaxID=1475485 RepID=A0ABY6Z6F9_9BACL|nr:hypothetical protein [Alicyclobacillus dauci]WAH38472.1 hypothetical protein NZD86_08325 [Alicyclobacillus dauci]